MTLRIVAEVALVESAKSNFTPLLYINPFAKPLVSKSIESHLHFDWIRCTLKIHRCNSTLIDDRNSDRTGKASGTRRAPAAYVYRTLEVLPRGERWHVELAH